MIQAYVYMKMANYLPSLGMPPLALIADISDQGLWFDLRVKSVAHGSLLW